MYSPLRINVRALALAFAATTVTACTDDLPSAASERSLAPQVGRTAAMVPVDSIAENPVSLAVAKEVSSFGGLYFDDQGQLVIAMTDVSRRADAERSVRNHLVGEHGTARGAVNRDNVRFAVHAVEYPFLDLARYRTILREYVFGVDGVLSLDVKESANRVYIGVERDDVESEVRGLLSRLEIPQEAVHVWRHGPVVEDSHTLTGSMGSIHGAWRIFNSNYQGCTLGFAARRASDASFVFVTNSHCTAARFTYDGGAITQNGTLIGYEIVDPGVHTCSFWAYPQQCRHSDAALISASVPIQLGAIARTTDSSGCEDCSMSLTVDHANPTLQITLKYGVVFENEILHKIGATTGWTYGAVEDACTDILSSGVVKRCSARVDYSRDEGDSGAPVFSLRHDGTVALRGVHFGALPKWSGAVGLYDAVMSTLNQVEKDLGGLTVFDSGTPTITFGGPSVVALGPLCRWTVEVSGGIPPYSNPQWTGLASSTDLSVEFYPLASGYLNFQITDYLGRTAYAAHWVSVEGTSNQIVCPEYMD